MSQPTVLVFGDCDLPEMSPIRNWIGSLGLQANIRRCKVLSDAIVDPPDLVIVCQSWPDEFPAMEVTQAIGRWPLALWVCCYGAWCASDGRTRSVWPVSVRVPIDEAECRLNHIWQVLTEQRDGPLPLTASRDEAFAFDHCVTTPVARP